VKKQSIKSLIQTTTPKSVISIIKDNLATASELCGIVQPSAKTLVICARHVLQEYTDLTTDEIIVAFKLASMDKLPGISLSKHSKTSKPLNLVLINELLMAYRIKKKDSLQNHKNQQRLAQQAQKKITACPPGLFRQMKQDAATSTVKTGMETVIKKLK